METQLVQAAIEWTMKHTALGEDNIGHDKCSKTETIRKEAVGSHLGQKHDRGHRRKHFATALKSAGANYCNGRTKGLEIAFGGWSTPLLAASTTKRGF